jgi:hypothetical protein
MRSILIYFVTALLCSYKVNGFAPTGAFKHNISIHRAMCKGLRYETKPNANQKYEDAIHKQLSMDMALSNKRRSFLSLLALTPLTPTPTNAIPFFSSNHRQLELCLVTILRTQFWAMTIAKSLQTKLLSTSPSSDTTEENVRKLPYLEARLGAKAILTQKIGGGATTTVLKLASFNIKECLEDGSYWANQLVKSNQLDKQSLKLLASLSEEIVESLASVVEFDGLETTIDPSPRSSLMLSMYTPQKGTFVYRTLIERVIPSCERYLNVFGDDEKMICLEFVRRDYSDEIPFEVLMDLYDDDENT